MAKITVDLPFADATSLPFSLDQLNLGEIVCPMAVPAVSDETEAITSALDNPLGTPPLDGMMRVGQRVLVLVDDNTRPTPTHKILPHLLERLQRAGLASTDIEILIAAGTHRPMTDEEVEAKLGREVAGSVVVTRHRCDDPSQLVKAGTSSAGVEVWLNRKVVQADIVMGIGNVVPHPHTGWSGGAKILYPGVAGAETIAAFHQVAIEDPTNQLGRDETPARQSLEDLGATIGLDFIINTVLTPEQDLYRIFCGHPLQAQAAAREASRQVYGVPVHRRHNIVVSNSYPAYLEFWQASKGLFAGDLVVKPGGAIILTAACPEGLGVTHPEQVEYLSLSLGDLLHRISVGGVMDPIAAAICVKTAQIRARARIAVVAPGLDQADIRRMGFEPYASVEEALKRMLAVYGAEQGVAVITHGGQTVPYVI